MATIKDIADAAGISIGTVDRIIHKRGRYSEKTAEKVREIMSDLNYSPNMHARGLKKTRNYIFAAVLPREEQDSGYWGLVADGIKRASEELSPFCEPVKIYTFDRYSSDSCTVLLKRILSENIDGLLIAPVVPEAVRGLLTDTEIPFLFVDTDIPDLKKRMVYIGQDSLQSGILSGKLMRLMVQAEAGWDEFSTGEDFILVVEPPGSNYHLKSRIEGFRKYITENLPSVLVQRVKIETDDEEEFHKRIKAFYLEKNRPPLGIFAANSCVYYIASFLERLGFEHSETPLIGYDLIPGKEIYIENGTIDFILTQQPEEQAYRGVMMLYDGIVLKKKFKSELFIPLNIITKENLDTFRK